MSKGPLGILGLLTSLEVRFGVLERGGAGGATILEVPLGVLEKGGAGGPTIKVPTGGGLGGPTTLVGHLSQ